MLADSSLVIFVPGDIELPLKHLCLYCSRYTFLNMFGDPTRVPSIIIAKTSGLWEILLLLENLSFYETLVIWLYRVLIKDQKVHAVKAGELDLCSSYLTEESVVLCFFYRLEKLYMSITKKTKLSEYWKNLTLHFINK